VKRKWRLTDGVSETVCAVRVEFTSVVVYA
jgi:hypothetical protein